MAASTFSPNMMSFERDSNAISLSSVSPMPLRDECDTFLEEGDVMLKTRDGTTFRVWRHTLRMASPFFAGMFALPQPSGKRVDDSRVESGLSLHTSEINDEVIPLDDDAEEIRIILLMISARPFPIQIFDSLPRITALLRLTEKYTLLGPQSIIRCSILRPSLLANHSLELYALACTCEWIDVARIAAEHALDHDLTSPESMRRLAGLDVRNYAKLVSLARRRVDEFARKLDDELIFQGSSPLYLCRNCSRAANDLTWKVLRLTLREMLERCPSGKSIREKGVRDEGTKAGGSGGGGGGAWSAVVNARYCSNFPLYAAEGTRETILRILDGLPMDLEG